MKMTRQIVSFSSGIDQKKAENILPIKNAKMTYNFAFSDGSLVSGLGFETLNCPNLTQEMRDVLTLSLQSVDCVGSVFYFRKYDFESMQWADKLIVFDDEFNAFYVDIFSRNAQLIPLGIKFSSRPFGVSYRLNSQDVFFLASVTDNMIVWDGVNQFEVVADAPHITSMAVHFERLFVTTAGDKSELWFSDDLDPTNWNVNLNDAGFIQMVDERGSLRKVISFNNYLYVFRDYGISRLSASSSQSGFFLSHLFVSSSRIFENTITVCGDRIIFLTSEGLFQFDGASTTKIIDNLSSILKGSNISSAAFLNGKYYLSCKVDFGDDYYNDSSFDTNALFVLDVLSREYQIVRGIQIMDLVSVLIESDPFIVVASKTSNYPLLQISDGYSENNLPLILKKVWRSAFSDLGYPNKFKTLRNLHLFVHGEGAVTLTSELESVTLILKSGVNSYPLLLSGKQFMFEFYSEDVNVELSDLVLDFYM